MAACPKCNQPVDGYRKLCPDCKKRVYVTHRRDLRPYSRAGQLPCPKCSKPGFLEEDDGYCICIHCGYNTVKEEA